MKSRIPNPGTIIAVVALVLAVTGTAIAVTKAPKNSVVSKSIKNGQVKTKDLKNNAVKSSKLADGSVGSSELAGGAVTADKVNVGSLAGSFGSGILGAQTETSNILPSTAELAEAPAIGEGGEFDLVVPVNAQVRDLAAVSSGPLPAGASTEVRISKVGTGKVLSCTIAAGASSCSAPGPAAFAAGDRLSVSVHTGAGANAIGPLEYEIGYRLAPGA